MRRSLAAAFVLSFELILVILLSVSIMLRNMSLVSQVAWKWLSFTNSARKDDLQLYHWVRSLSVCNAIVETL